MLGHFYTSLQGGANLKLHWDQVHIKYLMCDIPNGTISSASARSAKTPEGFWVYEYNLCKCAFAAAFLLM